MSHEWWLVVFFEALAVVGFVIAMRSTGLPAAQQRRPGERTEDHEIGLGFGCAWTVLGVCGLLGLGVLWLVVHLRIVP